MGIEKDFTKVKVASTFDFYNVMTDPGM